MTTAEAARRVPSLKIAKGAGAAGSPATAASRSIPEETPVALVYDGATYAVMMATPADLEDFGVGFSLTEGLISTPDEITALEVVTQPTGREIRMWVAPGRGRALVERRRRIAGPTGCGLCGVESLEAAVARPPTVPTTLTVTPAEIHAALAAMPAEQALNSATRAVHAAAYWDSDAHRLVALREDVGRHNALDKLVGALRREAARPPPGVVLLTSRVSVEMVQKAAVLGAELIVAVSAPTALALETADAAGISLVAIARSDGFEVFTHPSRIATGANATDRSALSEVSRHAPVVV